MTTAQRIERDVVVIGGGPAGATASGLLAQKGHHVTVLEKTRFPRYHIGESLMPHCWFPLNRLGVLDKVKAAAFTTKYSVQFVRPTGELSVPFYFFKHRDHPSSITWQVNRDEFDKLLLDHAADLGAEVRYEHTAKSLIEEDGRVVGVRAVDDADRPIEFRAPMVIDASGRDALSLNRHDWRERDPKLNKMAVWTYYEGAKRDDGLDEGATTVAYVPQRGWFWYIPLKGDVVSVGVVAERDYLYRDGVKDPQAVFEREVTQNKWIEDHLAVGRPIGKHWVTSEYSYRGRYCARDGLVLVGDAFAFLDPVFSSGVLLALKSGQLAADAVDLALRDGDTSAARFDDYAQTLCSGIETMRSLVYAFYDEAFSFGKLIRKHPDVHGDLTDCLIGDLFRDYDALQTAIREFAELPGPLPHGRPLVGTPA
jgi:flavin-dependent dehydrogenase